MRFSCRAWNPAHPSKDEWVDVNLRRCLARLSSGKPLLMYCCLTADSWAAVCWQMGLWVGQLDLWQSVDCFEKGACVSTVRQITLGIGPCEDVTHAVLCSQLKRNEQGQLVMGEIVTIDIDAHIRCTV